MVMMMKKIKLSKIAMKQVSAMPGGSTVPWYICMYRVYPPLPKFTLPTSPPFGCGPPTCVYVCVPCLQVLTLVYLIYMHSIDIYLCLLRFPHCMRLHVQLRYLCLHTWAIQVYIYVVPVSENFILTMMITLEVMMSMRRMTVTMTWMVTDCISTMMMKITREMKTKMMYK